MLLQPLLRYYNSTMEYNNSFLCYTLSKRMLSHHTSELIRLEIYNTVRLRHNHPTPAHSLHRTTKQSYTENTNKTFSIPSPQKINRHGNMAVGAFKKSYVKMTPSAFGVAPCCMADGTPTQKVKTVGKFHKKKTHPRQSLCGYQCNKILHRLRMGFLTTPNPHPCGFKNMINHLPLEIKKKTADWRFVILTTAIPVAVLCTVAGTF